MNRMPRLIGYALMAIAAALALAQHCSAIPAPAPLFTALLNYRHNVRGAASAAPPGVRICLAEERTNYPLAVVVDDDEASLGITIDANAALDARSLWRMLRHTLVQLIGALESQPELAIEQLEVLSSEEQEQALRPILCDKRPEQLKIEFALWSRAAVMQLIECEYGISLL